MDNFYDKDGIWIDFVLGLEYYFSFYYIEFRSSREFKSIYGLGNMCSRQLCSIFHFGLIRRYEGIGQEKKIVKLYFKF